MIHCNIYIYIHLLCKINICYILTANTILTRLAMVNRTACYVLSQILNSFMPSFNCGCSPLTSVCFSRKPQSLLHRFCLIESQWINKPLHPCWSEILSFLTNKLVWSKLVKLETCSDMIWWMCLISFSALQPTYTDIMVYVQILWSMWSRNIGSRWLNLANLHIKSSESL